MNAELSAVAGALAALARAVADLAAAPVAAPPAPPTQLPTLPPVPAPAPPAPAVAPAAEPITWREMWREDWADLRLGGWIRHEPTFPAPQGLGDPGTASSSAFGVPAGGWAAVGGDNARAALSVRDGMLWCDATQSIGQGFSILSQRRFDRTRPIQVSATIEVLPDPGAWCGLTLFNGEGNYREIGLEWMAGKLMAVLHTPRYYEVLGEVSRGAHRLTLIYGPALGWRMEVDGVALRAESPGYRANLLTADPHVGLYMVNLDVEAGRAQTGGEHVRVGPVVVQQG